jgi:hypothetical protein
MAELAQFAKREIELCTLGECNKHITEKCFKYLETLLKKLR